MILLLLFISSSSAYLFQITKNIYNGSISNEGYQGFINNCPPQFYPSTKADLLKYGFWNTNLPLSWIFTTENNCLGYSTNSSYVDGTCIDTSNFLYTTTCSCNMLLPLLCIYII